MNQLSLTNMNHIHGSSPSPSSDSHATSFPFIAVAIIGIFATILLLVFYYIFVIKCCLNYHRIDILRRFSLSRNTNNHNYHHHHPLVSSSPEFTGLDESVIRSIPVFRFRKQANSDNECAVCLGEFEENEKLRIIPNCGHVFHIDCIDVWLQNNPNCPLCRNSISISIPIPTHVPVPEHIPQASRNINDDQDYVVIELSGGDGDSGVGSEWRRHVAREDQSVDSREREPVTRKLMEKLRKRYGYESSMGDECIGVNTRRKGDEQFLIQPIRRSISMDSAADRQLFMAVQEIRNSLNHVDLTEVNDGCSSSGNSSSRIRRGFFSFGHGRSAILPFHLKP